MADDFIIGLKNISIISVLKDLYGIDAHKRGDRYFAKIRPERTESCCIYPNNTFYDFGGGVGGDVITLVSLLSDCSNKEAQNKLSTYSGITRESRVRDEHTLMDYEWKKLGIYPELASKNINFCFMFSPSDKPNWMADLNIRLYEKSDQFELESKYYISVEDMRKKFPEEYHQLLRNRVLQPLFAERDDYYLSVIQSYKFGLAIGNESFASKCVKADQELSELAASLNEKCSLLRRAVDDNSLLKAPYFKLNPSDDLQKILTGSIEFQTSKVRFTELCKYAKMHHETFMTITIPYDNYIKAYSETKNLHAIPHCTFYKNGNCKLCFVASKTKEIGLIFGDEITKNASKFDGFSHKNEPIVDKF